MEHESPALVMFLGGATSLVYPFFALVSFSYPMTIRGDLGANVGGCGRYGGQCCCWLLSVLRLEVEYFYGGSISSHGHGSWSQRHICHRAVLLRAWYRLHHRQESTIFGERLAQAGPTKLPASTL